jgi:hypothetical protein
MGLAVGTTVGRRTAGVACATTDLGRLVNASVEASNDDSEAWFPWTLNDDFNVRGRPADVDALSQLM